MPKPKRTESEQGAEGYNAHWFAFWSLVLELAEQIRNNKGQPAG